jgi:hypothetical protein
MRIPGKKGNDDGLLSFDFIIGFTIFMIALIFVAIMISGLLVQLQSRTIDYDAVAYRTSTILVEDPGEPDTWHLKNMTYPAERDDVKRLGLAVDKNYPGILKMNKVKKFFNSSSPSEGCYNVDQFCNPEDYKKRLIFGDYPYRFNISMKVLNSTYPPYSVGNPIPENISVGFVKRIVKIQIPRSWYNLSFPQAPDLNKTNITIRIDFTDLYGRISPYRIDPLNENINITMRVGLTNTTNITGARICTYPLVGIPGCIASDAYEDSPRMYVLIDENEISFTSPQPVYNQNITVVIDDGYFQRVGFDRFDAVDTILTFDNNVTNQSIFFYNYSTVDPLPYLEPAVIEVRVW